jgi:hypothetical protein
MGVAGVFSKGGSPYSTDGTARKFAQKVTDLLTDTVVMTEE